MWCRHLFIACVCIFTTLMQHLSSAAAISECPGLQVDDIRLQRANFELSVELYHVSWSNSSRRALTLFNEVSQLYHESVHFAVIDCWHLACNCTHPDGSGTPNQWPTLMLHYGRNTQLQYFGDWSRAALTRFIDNLFRPLERVHDKRELKTIAMRSDAVILGLFPDSNTIAYRRFAGAAVKWLETDPEKSFRFAASFGAVAEMIGGQQQLPIILLLSPRGVEVYKPKSEWNSTKIVHWAQIEMKRALNYVSGYSSPMTVAMQLRSGPTLTILANDLDTVHNFNTVMSKELDPRVTSSKSMACYAHASCKRSLSRLQLEHHGRKLLAAAKCPNIAHLVLLDLQHYYFVNDYLNELLCSIMPACISQRSQTDSAPKLLELHEHIACLQGPQQNAPEVRIAITRFLKLSVERLWNESLSPQNRTLTVTVLDHSKYNDFLHAQAIESFALSAATTFIADPRRESIYVMQEKFSYESLMNFVKNYYNQNLLTTHLQTSRFQQPSSASNAVYLHDFNRQTFLNVITQQNITTVVLLYTPTCAFSAILSQTLIQIAAMLDRNLVNIIRINTQTNALPWEFVMPETPAVIVFPRGRAVESRVFPSHFKADVRNVFGFILAQMEPVDQLKAVLSSCRRNLRPEHLKKCLLYAKNLATQHIGHHLKLWQIFEKERDFVLARLKQFKDITLDIKRSFMF